MLSSEIDEEIKNGAKVLGCYTCLWDGSIYKGALQ